MVFQNFGPIMRVNQGLAVCMQQDSKKELLRNGNGVKCFMCARSEATSIMTFICTLNAYVQVLHGGVQEKSPQILLCNW